MNAKNIDQCTFLIQTHEMTDHPVSARLSQFIFEFVDSVELIEVLFFMRTHKDESFSAAQISAELRSNPKSISNRLIKLVSMGLSDYDERKESYKYAPKSLELDNIVLELESEYRLRRHTIFELIFSTSKNARHFANAFIVKSNKSNGESDG